MDAKTYLKVSGVNLIFLAAGLLIGPTVVRSISMLRVVHAQNDTPSQRAPAKIEQAKPPKCDEARYECVSPEMTSGAAGFGTVLANRIASDQLMVNGFDPLKLHDGTLSALQGKGILTASDVQRIVESAKVAKPLRLRQ